MRLHRPVSLLAILSCLLLSILPVVESWAFRRRQPKFTTSSTSRLAHPQSHATFIDSWLSLYPATWNHVEPDGNCTPKIVVLIPAYNEERRIQSTLESYRNYLLQSDLKSEILVVDDGSTDNTVSVVSSYLEHEDNDQVPIHCISMPVNQGKGAALAAGIKHIVEDCKANNNNQTLILTQDADGSGNLMYLQGMIDRMRELVTVSCEEEESNDSQPANSVDWTKPAIVTGNRNYKLFSPRGITRWGFQAAVRLIMNDLRVQDSQCGYKLMTLTAAKDLYDDLEVSGWAHDVEVLYRAKLVDIPIKEIPIDWTDKDGSKVVESGVARVSVQMLMDVIRLRWEYSNLRAWLSLGDF